MDPPTATSRQRHHDDDDTPPPRQRDPSLHFARVPEPAHDVIASYMTYEDLHRMMETCQGMLKAYGGRVTQVVFPPVNFSSPPPSALSILKRRPGVVRVTSKGFFGRIGLIEAMGEGYCHKLQVLDLSMDFDTCTNLTTHLLSLLHHLSNGLCPKLHHLSLSIIYQRNESVMGALGPALRSRMEKGCCGLKVLELNTPVGYSLEGGIKGLSSILSSGACEALEVFKVEGCGLPPRGTQLGIVEWASKTRASNLRSFTYACPLPLPEAQALFTPGMAPQLQSLHVEGVTDQVAERISSVLKAHGWPGLKELRLTASADNDITVMANLMEVLDGCAPHMQVLEVKGAGALAARDVLQALEGGRCKHLEELSIWDCYLQRLGPFPKTVRRLTLHNCEVEMSHVRGMIDGIVSQSECLPNLEYLDLSKNPLEDKGVKFLMEAMRSSQGRILPALQELLLEEVYMEDGGAGAVLDMLMDRRVCPRLKLVNLKDNAIYDEDLIRRLRGEIRGGAVKVEVFGRVAGGYMNDYLYEINSDY